MVRMYGSNPVRPPSGTHPRVGRVLVVDDDPRALAEMVAVLSQDHQVVGTLDPFEAVRRLAAGERFDVLLYDLMMRGMAGAEVFARVCAISTRQASRIVFLGTGTMPLSISQFLSRVEKPCLQRPIEPHVLRAEIAKRVAEAERMGPGSVKTG